MARILLTLSFFSLSTYAFADNGDAPIYIVSFLLIIVVVAVLAYQAKNKPANYSRSEADSLRNQAEESLGRLGEEGIATLSNVPILLRDGETAFLTEASDLFELETIYLTGGITTSNGSITGGVARSTPVEQMTKMDSGSLTLTNRRIAFVGKDRTRDFELSKILDVKVQGNCVVIGGGSEGKNSLFSVKNPYFWESYIRKLLRGDQPGNKGTPGPPAPEGGFKRKVRGTPDMKPFEPIE